MARAVGLDVGARHVRLVEADGGGRSLRVVRLGERDLVVPEGADREEAVREAVDALFRDTRAGRDEVVLSWPAENCTIREVCVPFRDADQIRKVVKYEFESHLHAQSIDEVVLDFVPTGETKEGTRLLCVAAPKAPLRARMEALAKVKVDPVAVDVDVTALASAAAAAGVLDEAPTCVLVDMGTRTTRIVLVVEGRVRAGRAFRSGPDSGAAPADAAPAAALEDASASGTEALPADAGATALAVAEDRRTGLVGRIAREVSRTLANAAPGVSFPVAFVSGRGSLAPGAREGLASPLGIEVRSLDLLGRVAHPVPADRIEESAAIFAVALGAAARGLGIGPAPVDLRREDLAYARRFDQVKGALAAGLGLLLLAVGFLLWRAKSEKEVATAEFNSMVATLKKTSDAVESDYRKALGEEQARRLWPGTGEDVDTAPDAKRRVVQMYNHLRDEMGLSTEVPPIRSCLEVVRAVNEAVRSVRPKLEYCLVTSQVYNQKEVQVNVVLSVPENVDVLKKAFEEVKGKDGKALFPSVEYSTVAQNKQGKYAVPFTLRFEKK